MSVFVSTRLISTPSAPCKSVHGNGLKGQEFYLDDVVVLGDRR